MNSQEQENNSIHVIDMRGGEPSEYRVPIPKLPEWHMADEIGYEPKTTFWQDFSIAERFGSEAIIDTFTRAFAEWRNNVVYIAELALVLNHKGFFYYALSEKLADISEELARVGELYFTLYRELHDWARDFFDGDDGQYYFDVVD